jgi:hypothetical protein
MAERIVLTPSQRTLFASNLRAAPFVTSVEETVNERSEPVLKVKLRYSKFLLYVMWAEYSLVVPEAGQTHDGIWRNRSFPGLGDYEIYLTRSFIFDTLFPIVFLGFIAMFFLGFSSPGILGVGLPLFIIAVVCLVGLRVIYSFYLSSTFGNAAAKSIESRAS